MDNGADSSSQGVELLQVGAWDRECVGGEGV